MDIIRYLRHPDQIIPRIVKLRRTAFYNKLKSRVKNPAPSIISCDCFGTFIYHNLGMQFNSPTINLTIEAFDFIFFVKNLKGCLDAELKEEKSDKPYPCGYIEYNGRKIIVNFVHYDSFESAKLSWDERKTRVDYSNIYIVIDTLSPDKELFDEFLTIENDHKLFISNVKFDSPYSVVPRIYKKKTAKPGLILLYKSRWAAKRWMDDIDYVNFINQGHE